MCPENDILVGTITGFINSPSGELAFAETDHYGSVSILLTNACWKGLENPRKGEMIVLEGVARFATGWRAIAARKFTADDESLVED